ncbi:hypothetical protein A6S26_33315 [Nostoc sp. ATCC 43529]|nr:hypothetical protein A6S26_33315 [Nostoc sp. ATCC 43529]
MTIAIGFLGLLLIIPAINAAIASQPNKRTHKLGLAQSQIKLLEDELQLSQQKYWRSPQHLNPLSILPSGESYTALFSLLTKPSQYLMPVLPE